MLRSSKGWPLLAALSAASALVTGCASSVDPDELPGLYRNDGSGAEILLESDGQFSATGVSTGEVAGPASFSGRWEFVDSQGSSDFIYLTVGGGLGKIAGIQLYPSGQGAVEFRPDPDGKPLPKLTRVTTQ
ncbi:hypothetical protein ABZ330_18910 [Streptomyces sp. NPDC006172]|uniref:hypothetical protein n=1 Tax=Streptomyces sp. NPDC006172 TaxID=3154470 RepID=UPI0033D4BBBD